MASSRSKKKSKAKGAIPHDSNRPVEDRPLIDKKDRLPLLLSVGLHLVLVILFVFNWSSASEPIKPAPRHIQATVLSADQIPYLEKKKQEEAAKKKALEKKRKLEEKKRKEKKAAELKKKKQLEEKRKKEAAKKAKIKKEKEKKEKEKKERERKERERKEKERLEAAAEKERLRKEQEQKEKELAEKRKAREEQLLQKLETIETQQREDEKRQAELEAAQAARAAFEVSETERFIALISDRVYNRWVVPPGARNDLKVLMRLYLLPSGELVKVEVVEPSGMRALDQSALIAVESVRKYPVPSDSELFNKSFRTVIVSLTPANKF